MSPISSRTPEGEPGRCPACGANVVVLPAAPLADAPCPACGVLIWPLAGDKAPNLIAADELPAEKRAALRELALRYQAAVGDSLERVELLMELEALLEISIPDEVAERFRTVEEFLDWWLRGREGASGS